MQHDPAAETRLAEARRLQTEMEARHAQENTLRRAREAVAKRSLIDDLDPATGARLAKMPLAARRYRLPERSREALREMGCCTLADVAAVQRDRLDHWMGYRLADLVRERVTAIVERIRAGHPEPGIWRVHGLLEPDLRARLAEEPLDRLAGKGIRRPVLDGIAAHGIRDLAALAEAELDDVETVPGCGPATLVLLQERLLATIESLPRPARDRTREDADWDAAAPRTKNRRRST